MSKFFMPLWLPISIIAHIILLMVLQFMPLNATVIPGDRPPVTLVEIVDNGDGEEIIKTLPPPPPSLPPPPPPPPPVKPEAQPPVKNPVKVAKTPLPVGVINPPKVSNKPTGYLGKLDPAKPDGISGPGKSQKPSAAPAVIHGSGHDVPSGKPGGTGMTNEGDSKETQGGGRGGGLTYGVQVISIGPASYPKAALNEDRNGTVKVLVSVNPDGNPVAVDISSSSGSNDIDAAAKRAALRSHFKAAMKNGETVSSTIIVTYRFANGRISIDY